LNITHRLAHRAWKSVGLKPHLLRIFKLTDDPQFEEKLQNVVALYVDPPQKTVVFSIDKKTSIQAPVSCPGSL
jgi:hypothetical protein